MRNINCKIRGVVGSILLFSSVGLSAQAGMLETKIEDLWLGSGGGPESRVYFVLSTEDGRVYHVPKSETPVLVTLWEANAKSIPVKIVTDEQTIIAAILTDQSEDVSVTYAQDIDVAGYLADNYSSEQEPRNLFRTLTGDFRWRTQCYQRAHVWAHMMWVNQSVKSMKVFLFFTRRYIEQYHYKWWFHVAPFVYVNNEPRVLDYEYAEEPMAMFPWTDMFIEPKAPCPVISHYTEYSLNQYREYCYVRYMPMYYFQPMDVQAFDRTGIPITGFRQRDLDLAYRGKR